MSQIYDEFEAYLQSQTAVPMQSFIRGQRAKINQFSDRTRRFSVQIALSSARISVFDFVCFGIDAQGQLSDDRYMVFFNQTRAPDDSIFLEKLSDTQANFVVDLDLIPPSIARLVFTTSVDGVGTMSDLSSSTLHLREEGVPSSQPLLEYRFSGAHFAGEGALMLAEIYRKDGEWRFWAQGQGFAGNLSALLKHFGGQEIEDSAQAGSTSPSMAPAPPTSAPPASPPSAPTSSPAIASVVVTPPPPAVSSTQNALQTAINNAASGSTLKLVRGEFQGPITVDKPLILDGSGAVIWAQNGPVVRVSSAGVTLRDLEVEATAPDPGPHNDVALWIEDGANTQLQDVRVRGEIVGVAAAQGQWKLPPSLNLGEFAARESNSFAFEIEVPHACDLKTNISGLSIVPPRVDAGRASLEVRVSGIGSDTFLAGHIELSSGGVGRTIPLSGRSTSGAAAAQGVSLWRVDSTHNGT